MSSSILRAARLTGRHFDTDTDTAIQALDALENADLALDTLETRLRANPTQHNEADDALNLWMAIMSHRRELSDLIERLAANSGAPDASVYLADAAK